MRRGAMPMVLAGGLVLLGAAGVYLWALGGPVLPQAAQDDWHLVNTQGQTIAAHDLRGRYLLLYFGYTSCPDLCPETLATVVAARRLLGGTSARLLPVFVSVDPARDTPAVFAHYVSRFGGGLIGLTGSMGQIAAVRGIYGIVATPMGTAIDHSSVLVLIGPDGRFIAALPATMAAPELARELEKNLT